MAMTKLCRDMCPCFAQASAERHAAALHSYLAFVGVFVDRKHRRTLLGAVHSDDVMLESARNCQVHRFMFLLVRHG